MKIKLDDSGDLTAKKGSVALPSVSTVAACEQRPLGLDLYMTFNLTIRNLLCRALQNYRKYYKKKTATSIW